jgi:hypothetical protein
VHRPSPRALAQTPLLLALALLAACGSDPVPTLAMRIVTPAGLDPRAAGGLERVVIRVRETPPGAAPREVVVLEGDATTDFALDYTLLSTASRIDVGVDLTGPAARLIGAAAPFVPDETDGAVDVLVGPPASCALRAGVTLAAPRGSAYAARLGSYALVAGGIATGSDAATRVELVDLLGARPTVSDPLAIGGAPFDAADVAVVALSSRAALLLARDRDEAMRYDLDAGAAARSTAVLVHVGARGGTLASRATFTVANGGAAIVGGVDVAGAPLADITWIAADGSTTHGSLAVPRRAPAVLALDDGTLLVAGGAELAGAPLLERIAEGAASAPLASTDDDGIRRGAALVAVPAAGAAFLLGGVDATGAPRTDVRIFDACPGACTLVEDAELAALLPDATLASLPIGGALLAGGRDLSGAPTGAAWFVTLAPTAPRLSVVARLPLAAGRAGSAALVLPSGLVWLFAGSDASGPRDDVEVCFPDVVATP